MDWKVFLVLVTSTRLRVHDVYNTLELHACVCTCTCTCHIYIHITCACYNYVYPHYMYMLYVYPHYMYMCYTHVEQALALCVTVHWVEGPQVARRLLLNTTSTMVTDAIFLFAHDSISDHRLKCQHGAK